MKECFVPRRFRKTSLVAIERANAILDEYRAKGFEAMTLRQIFYQFVARQFLPNTVPKYKGLLSILNHARLAGVIDWDNIQDESRTLRSRPSWGNPTKFMASVVPQYHLNRWEGQQHRVEVWVEKEALVLVLGPTCHRLDVPLFACKGNDSQGLMYESAQRLKESLDDGKTVTVLYLGDHDPTGVDISRDIRERLDIFGCGDVELERIALNIDQVRDFNLPSQTVKEKDKRTPGYKKKFGDQCWELDALAPEKLVELVDSEICRRIDIDVWNRVVDQEAEDHRVLDEALPFLEALREAKGQAARRVPVV